MNLQTCSMNISLRPHFLRMPCMDLSLEEFSNHPSITTSISSQNFNLAFSFQPVSAEYIGKLLSDLKINKSCSPDNIPPKILKLFASAIKEPLTKVINYCITESSWPLHWKRSHITPVHKKWCLICKELQTKQHSVCHPKVIRKSFVRPTLWCFQVQIFLKYAWVSERWFLLYCFT